MGHYLQMHATLPKDFYANWWNLNWWNINWWNLETECLKNMILEQIQFGLNVFKAEPPSSPCMSNLQIAQSSLYARSSPCVASSPQESQDALHLYMQEAPT
jgi:hypothetical protein